MVWGMRMLKLIMYKNIRMYVIRCCVISKVIDEDEVILSID